MLSITLPRLAGTREAADRLVDEQAQGAAAFDTVCVFARDLSVSSTSFTDEFFKKLSEGGAAEVLIFGGPETFISAAEKVLERRKLTTKVRRASAAELPA
ncbi:hypothetical protein GSU69_02790 [Rathayibacter festucae]|uniref:DUF4180 domain-containing protein n=1 Tax=Rathayibacter festucae TaxID=110937 RepID=A0ABX6GW68_9MICO|nr:hypothetical protein [Rathayibacter festucae]QHC61727.1 hypothetical protein GSU69_02790 [Rathayibacter festucae]